MLDQVKVFEVIKPEWHSDKKSSFALRVHNTGCSSTVPPLIAPFDFSIDPTWWQEYGTLPGYKSLLEDWKKHLRPQVFKPLEFSKGMSGAGLEAYSQL
ncbi:hypothetical protein C0995_009285, partial [Termitomyces sp. Mi166